MPGLQLGGSLRGEERHARRRGDSPERLHAVFSTASLFPTLGVSPVLGRAFTEEEETPGREQVLLLTH